MPRVAAASTACTHPCRAQIQAEFARHSIIALQEVCAEWTAALEALCKDWAYTFIPAHYGLPRSGYMGVALAVSNTKYRVLDVDIQRATETRAWPTGDAVCPPDLWARTCAAVCVICAVWICAPTDQCG